MYPFLQCFDGNAKWAMLYFVKLPARITGTYFKKESREGRWDMSMKAVSTYSFEKKILVQSNSYVNVVLQFENYGFWFLKEVS